LPRYMEVALCGAGLVVLFPLLLLIALLIKLTSEGPVLFRQERCGWYGRPFMLLKFRSMVDWSQERGPLVTASGDARITWLGALLRRTKLDELPQLWNVVRGDMALVGPRPEVPCYIQHYPQQFALVLQQRPGITDAVTVHLRHEETLLAHVEDSERYYVETLLPRKLGASIREGWRRSLWRDARVLVATVLPGLAFLAPAVDFRPLADLYTLPAARPHATAAQQGGAAVVGHASR
jgi:lipopolysaccharide/colanic/teichoic acid biosynthesis glycosyltransferase